MDPSPVGSGSNWSDPDPWKYFLAVRSQLDASYIAKSAGSENPDFKAMDALICGPYCSFKTADFQTEKSRRES
jgi:hypothetical protein